MKYRIRFNMEMNLDVSAQANACEAGVKPRSGGRSHNIEAFARGEPRNRVA